MLAIYEKVRVGDPVICRPVVLDGYMEHGYVGVGTVLDRVDPTNDNYWVVETQGGRDLSYEMWELRRLLLLEFLALRDLAPDDERLRAKWRELTS